MNVVCGVPFSSFFSSAITTSFGIYAGTVGETGSCKSSMLVGRADCLFPSPRKEKSSSVVSVVDVRRSQLLAQLRRMADDGYLEQRRLDALGVVGDAAGLLAFVEGYEHPPRKWAAR